MSDDEERPAHSHLIDFPEALEQLFGRMSELRLMVGPNQRCEAPAAGTR